MVIGLIPAAFDLNLIEKRTPVPFASDPVRNPHATSPIVPIVLFMPVKVNNVLPKAFIYGPSTMSASVPVSNSNTVLSHVIA